jgi:hypothetical protein
MNTLANVLEKLKGKEEVDAVFITGSQGTEHKPYSDIDLVIILHKHQHDLGALYTWIDGTFADVFFFDHADLERIENSEVIPGNKMDGVLVRWLDLATVQFDKSGKLTKMIEKRNDLSKVVAIPKSEKDSFCWKINYNFIANTRYFESNDPLYHEALEARLLYSVSEVFVGYSEFRNILWRGEKQMIKYLKEHDQVFYHAFIAYTRATNLTERFQAYSKMVQMVFTSGFEFWQ